LTGCIGLLGSEETQLRFAKQSKSQVEYTLLEENEFAEIVKTRPNTLSQLREKYGIQNPVRTCPDLETH
jgi:hypothetical protein